MAYRGVRKEVRKMPTLKHLQEELEKLGADPSNLRMPAAVYDDLVAQAEQPSENLKEEE